MRQGLIAQWHRGVALRGLIGALLLMVPVLVAATIGFGGDVSGGLSSLASGPSESTVGAPEEAQKTKRFERLTTTVPELALTSQARKREAPTDNESPLSPQGITPSGGAPAPAGDTPSGGGGEGSPGGGTGGGGTGAPAPPPGGGGGGQAPEVNTTLNTLNQLLQQLGLAPSN